MYIKITNFNGTSKEFIRSFLKHEEIEFEEFAHPLDIIIETESKLILKDLIEGKDLEKEHREQLNSNDTMNRMITDIVDKCEDIVDYDYIEYAAKKVLDKYIKEIIL